MPELPEVETIAQQLNQVLSGKVIKLAERLNGLGLEIAGKRVEEIYRKQKIIVFKLSGREVLLVHLKMTGQLVFVPESTESNSSNRVAGGHPTNDWRGSLPSKHTRVVIEFTDGSKLYFNDQRKFGWMKLMLKALWLDTLEKMAPDVVDSEFTTEYLGKILKKSTRAIKLVILDQSKVGGMGNIYACDALYLARINPKIPSHQVKDDAVKRLHQAMIEVINKGIETGGASMTNYVNALGVGGHYQDHFLVYNREGEKCKRCGEVIEKIKLGGRGTYFCPNCQR